MQCSKGGLACCPSQANVQPLWCSVRSKLAQAFLLLRAYQQQVTLPAALASLCRLNSTANSLFDFVCLTFALHGID